MKVPRTAAIAGRSLPAICRLTLAVALPTLTQGCGDELPEPNIASSAGHVGYAERYPEQVDATRQELGAQQKSAEELTRELSSLPEALEDPPWPVVREVVDLADAEGYSQAYVDSYEATDRVARFYLEHREPIRQKVAGGAQYTAKQKGCAADVGSAAAHSLDKAMQEQLENALHAQSEAHAVIDAHETELGKKNVEVLRERADGISRVSYLVHVGTVRSKQRLEGLVADAEQVEQTLERRIERLEAEAKASQAPEADQKAAARELEAARSAKGRVAQQANVARPAAERAQEAVQQLQRAYRDAMQKLRDRLAQRGGEARASPAE